MEASVIKNSEHSAISSSVADHNHVNMVFSHSNHRGTESKQEFSEEEVKSTLESIASSGKFWLDWEILKSMLSIYLKQVLSDYPEAKLTEDQQNSSLGETYLELVKRLDDALHSFTEGPPFTLQRLCEILLGARSMYSNLSKLSLALEKNLLVTSTLTICTDPLPSGVVQTSDEPDKGTDEPQMQLDAVQNGVEPMAVDRDETVMTDVKAGIENEMMIDMSSFEELVQPLDPNSTPSELEECEEEMAPKRSTMEVRDLEIAGLLQGKKRKASGQTCRRLPLPTPTDVRPTVLGLGVAETGSTPLLPQTQILPPMRVRTDPPRDSEGGQSSHQHQSEGQEVQRPHGPPLSDPPHEVYRPNWGVRPQDTVRDSITAREVCRGTVLPADRAGYDVLSDNRLESAFYVDMMRTANMGAVLMSRWRSAKEEVWAQNANYARMEAQLLGVRVDLEACQKDLGAMTASNAIMTARAERISRERVNLQAQVSSLIREIDELWLRIESLEQNVADLQEEVRELKAKENPDVVPDEVRVRVIEEHYANEEYQDEMDSLKLGYVCWGFEEALKEVAKLYPDVNVEGIKLQSPSPSPMQSLAQSL